MYGIIAIVYETIVISIGLAFRVEGSRVNILTQLVMNKTIHNAKICKSKKVCFSQFENMLYPLESKVILSGHVTALKIIHVFKLYTIYCQQFMRYIDS